MSKNNVESHRGSIPGFTIEKITHKDTPVSSIKDSDSLNTPSTSIPERKRGMFWISVLFPKKKLNEGILKSNFQYDDRTPDDKYRDDALTIPVSNSSSGMPGITIPESTVTRPEAVDTVLVDPHRHLHDIV